MTTHYSVVGKMLRFLAAVLACIAVLVGGGMTVAAATVPSGAPAMERSLMGEPCSRCDDCSSAPCPAPTVTCAQACAGPAPSLAAMSFRLPTADVASVAWSFGSVVRIGLSPSPDPFPPRA